MINADMQHKPPVAPKPRMVHSQMQGCSPAMPRKQGLALPSPGIQRKAKPAIAPRPCHPKPSSEVEPTSLASKSLDQTPVTEHPRTVGVFKSQNGIQQENKRPGWDYVIPICLCKQENCNCITHTSTHRDKLEKGLKTPHKVKTEDVRKLQPTSHVVNKDKTGNDKSQVLSNNPPQTVCRQLASTNTKPSNWKHLKEKPTLGMNAGTDASSPLANAGPSFPDRMLTNEKNVNRRLHGSKEEDRRDPEPMCQVPKPKPVPRKTVSAPVPRKPREAALAHQEKVEDEKEESVCHKGRGMKVREMKMSIEGKSSSSPSVNVPANENKHPARKAGTAPAPPPEKKPFLSEPASAPLDVVEEDLGWDSNVYELEVSVDTGKVLEKPGRNAQEAVYHDLTHHPVSSYASSQPKLNQTPANTAAADEYRPGKVTQTKPQSSPTTRMQRKESSEERGEHFDNDKRRLPPSQDCVLKELPSPPEKKKSRKLTKSSATKSSRSSLSKAKSFSGADVIRSQLQRKSSLRKVLDLKLKVQQVKGDQSPDSPPHNDYEVRLDKDPEEHRNFAEELRGERKVSLPLTRVEQSVDEDGIYETVRLYEDILDCTNAQEGKAESSPATWGDDEGIYEVPEPYVPFEKCTEQQQYQTQTYDRNSVGDDDDPSGETTFNSSDDEFEDDSSSTSSKGEREQPEGKTLCQTQSGQKKTKIHYIATEIMTSEGVFVDVLKLLHVDFREAVFKASRESGKPVIEERLLNQILYYLPQLYELNQDLLKELKERLAKWNETSQVADIFLKKGPYLKMYSTYIREYDKNAALLEEQTKRNPAFGAVVLEFEASPRCSNLALKHYLLKPIQRIPQYQLLLTDYLKNLSEDSADYKDTQAALALVKEVANHANDIIKQGDDFQKMMRVQCSLTGNQEIVQPGRHLLKEGPLMKLSRKIMQPRMFFLFNDVLLYTIPVQAGQYRLKYMLSLEGMKVSKRKQEAYQNELNIVSVQRSFSLSASSASERDAWLKALSTAITDYAKKMISFTSGKPPEEVDLTDYNDSAALGSKAPIWIPDLRVTMCMVCACEFTIARRRHHCRACGKVVCQSCSSHKHPLEYLKHKLARVCDQCFETLLQQKKTISPVNKATVSHQKKNIPKALKEVQANTDSFSMSGYLQMSKASKKQAKRLWFVIKDKVLYTYAASEDVAALESQPLLGFTLKEESSQKFTLSHQNKLYYSFKADDVETAQRWINAIKEAAVL